VLACTSSADLEELVHPIPLRDFLVQNAGIIYQHANSVRRVADEDSLYIISGCIKSDSWALAAYKNPAPATDDVLKLVRKTTENQILQTPQFFWTHRGTAEAHSGFTSIPPTSERHQRKDQCLFLRGFKMVFSPDFRSRLKDSPFKFDSRGAGGPNPKGPDNTHGGPDEQGRGKDSNSKGNKSGEEGPSSANPPRPSGSRNHSLAGGIHVDPFPPLSETVSCHDCVLNVSIHDDLQTFHPCDTITSLLLDLASLSASILQLSADESYLYSDRRGLCTEPRR
jgi:hypothetical protein